MPVDANGSRLVLVAHGSRDPRAERSTLALTRAVREAAAQDGWPGRVDAAFLDFSRPRLADVLARSRRAIVVPLLLTAAYHGRVDVPTEIARARAASPVDVRLAEVLGPVGGAVADRAAVRAVVAALVRRLDEAGALGADGIVLAAAGSRDPSAVETVELVAGALSAALGRPCRAGCASGTGPGVGAAAASLAAGGAARIAMASYFLAPGHLYDRAVEQARAAGATTAAAPLGDAPQVVDLILARAAEGLPVGATTAGLAA